MGLGLEGAYGVEGAWDSLRNIIAERKKDEILKYKQEEDRRQYELQVRQQQDSEKWRELQFETLQNERAKAQAERDRSNLEQSGQRITEAHGIDDVLTPQEGQTLRQTGQGALVKTPTPAEMSGLLGSLGAVPGMTPTLSAMLKTYAGTAQQQRQAQSDVLAAQGRKDAEERDARNATQQDRMYALAVQNANKPSFAFPTIMGPDGQPVVVGVNRRDISQAPVAIGGAAPTGAQRGQQSEAIAAGGGLDQLEKLYKDDYVGPLQGRINIAKATTGVSDDPNLAEFLAQSAAIKNRVIKAITGAQMSEVEAKRITGQIPEVTDPPAMWKAKLKATRDNYQFLLNAIAGKSGGGASPGAGGGGATPPPEDFTVVGVRPK